METNYTVVDTNNLRLNLTKYLKDNKGNTILFTHYNRLVGEISFYNEDSRVEKELQLLQRLIKDRSK